MVTETDELRDALNRAAMLYPEDADNRATLLRRIIHEGTVATLSQNENRLIERRRSIDTLSQSLSGVWDQSSVDELREDWPE